ncbi:MAG: hypothetical protein WCK02_15100 [Bacteroidota bacterium]
MATLASSVALGDKTISPSETLKGIENHKEAAKQHEEAAKHHHEAAKHHEKGEHGKAAQSSIKAQGHLTHAITASKQDVKHHALNG